MRKNFPVTSVEVKLDPSRPLISTTDLKGRITYVNPSFIEISGYSKEELIGEPHNIVRHPDMPPEAFEDLWKTVKRLQPWHGLVKNRTKNGDFYWVDAYVTPFYHNGEHTGYMSVRSAPAQADIESVSKLYESVNQKTTKLPKTPQVRWWHSITPIAAVLGLMCCLVLLGAVLFPHWIWMLIGLSGFAAATVIWHRKITLPLKRIEEALHQIESGQLNQRMHRSETFDLSGLRSKVESTRIHLRATMCDLMIVSRTVETGASAVASQIQTLDAAVQYQRERLMQIANEVQEISKAILDASKNTKETVDLSEGALHEVGEAQNIMQSSVQGTKEVSSAVGRTNDQLVSLRGLVSTIAGVTQSINEIAHQTRLLSLNAAIEAARAGEEGRGFSVVADEVRTLSDRTASSTSDIEEALSAITNFAKSTETLMSKAVESVDMSSTQIQESANSFSSVRDSSTEVAEKAKHISEMLAHQTQASKNISNSMENIAGQVDNTAQAVTTLTNVNQELQTSVFEMKHLLERYERSLH